MKSTLLLLPELPHMPHGGGEDSRPNVVMKKNADGTFTVTKNFSDDVPMWRIYKRFGWALRYLGISNPKRLNYAEPASPFDSAIRFIPHDESQVTGKGLQGAVDLGDAPDPVPAVSTLPKRERDSSQQAAAKRPRNSPIWQGSFAY